ncbi:hypothetical protein AB0F93_00295 [Micromonospora tulbaghiae]|uniref:hypothetical protein n=1 Tax=Micromonospora tulbaghiae TaxID=479978 RepID=UPI00331EF3ED
MDGVREPARPMLVRLFAPWTRLVDAVGVRWVSGHPRYGSWWRYLVCEPADAVYSVPRLAACRWFGRHSGVCDGRRDEVHLRWRRELIARRRAARLG